jgi:hypothetical protein
MMEQALLPLQMLGSSQVGVGCHGPIEQARTILPPMHMFRISTSRIHRTPLLVLPYGKGLE